MGVPVMKSLKTKHIDKLRDWVERSGRVEMYYPDITVQIIDRLLQESTIGQTS